MMSFKKSLLFFSLLLCSAFTAKSQVNMQVFYDFGSDRKFTTLTLEMFKGDKWGNTYFFVDTDFNYDQHVEGPNLAPGGSYLEIARCLNFWQNTKLAPLSLQVEYNGGITRKYPINNAWLVWIISCTTNRLKTPSTSRCFIRTSGKATAKCPCS